MAVRPESGMAAPAFLGEAIGRECALPFPVSSGDLTGRVLVLYFYPKDETPGCTKQACGLRDIWHEISNKAEVFGVSVDSIASHRKFIGKHTLPFPLLSDPDHRIAEAYGVWVEKNLYGKRYMGTERTTFVIGPDGIVKAVLAKVKPDEHAARLLEALEALET